MKFVPSTDDIKTSTDKTVEWKFIKPKDMIVSCIKAMSDKSESFILSQLETLFLINTGHDLKTSDAVIYYEYDDKSITFYTYTKTIVC
jgi:hypothetical protein